MVTTEQVPEQIYDLSDCERDFGNSFPIHAEAAYFRRTGIDDVKMRSASLRQGIARPRGVDFEGRRHSSVEIARLHPDCVDVEIGALSRGKYYAERVPKVAGFPIVRANGLGIVVWEEAPIRSSSW
jgi:hypothetical protein